ncbi:group 1 glycosyl transferase [Salinisphaera sp. S4-8]
MLALNWGFENHIFVCANPVLRERPALAKSKPAPINRCLKIGVVGRLTDVKGVALALSAISIANRRGIPCELHVAGTGPNQAYLKRHAFELGIASRVTWLGHIEQVDDFYDQVDCIVHATLHEPSGLVLREACAAACPVISTRIDGIPEWFGNSPAAQLIAPTIQSEDYARYYTSGRPDMPPVCYDPDLDCVRMPAAPDPETIADCIEKWTTDAEAYELASRSAIELSRSEGHSVESFNARLSKILDRADKSGPQNRF